MWREIRYLIAAPAMLGLYVLYVVFYRMRNHGGWWLAPIWLPVGLVLAATNITFNLTIGTFLFWEPPRQLFFSDRIRATDPAFKVRFQRLLNPHDAGHIA